MINFNFNPIDRKIVMLGSILMLSGILSGITDPIAKLTLQNVTMPQMRGTAFALHTAFDNLGRGLGPAFVAWMIEKLGGKRRAFNISAGSWMVCGFLNGLLFCTIKANKERVRLSVAWLVVANIPNEHNSLVWRDQEGVDLL
jgi:sugar phosphate permease